MRCGTLSECYFSIFVDLSFRFHVWKWKNQSNKNWKEIIIFLKKCAIVKIDGKFEELEQNDKLPTPNCLFIRKMYWKSWFFVDHNFVFTHENEKTNKKLKTNSSTFQKTKNRQNRLTIRGVGVEWSHRCDLENQGNRCVETIRKVGQLFFENLRNP